jgi:hypothetical protein
MADAAADILRELEASVLFAPDFPQRTRYSNEEWVALSKAAIEEGRRPQREALQRAGLAWKPLVDLIRGLGEARYEKAIPTLARLWHGCALGPVRVTAGHVLFAMHEDEARRALIALIDDSDPLSVALGVRAVFDGDPLHAYDYFAPRFADAGRAGAVVARAALALLAPGSFTVAGGKSMPRWRISARRIGCARTRAGSTWRPGCVATRSSATSRAISCGTRTRRTGWRRWIGSGARGRRYRTRRG